jgi:AcrR family transcriptional regulator
LEGRDTESRILEAARSLWHEGGFGAVTTRAVAARAGVNEVTLFRHFATKEGLLQAVVRHSAPKWRPAPDVDASASTAVGPYPDLDIEEDLGRWALAYLRPTCATADVILLGLVEARGRSDIAAACLEVPRALASQLCTHLRALGAAGRIRPAPYEAIAEAFYAALFAHVVTADLRPGASPEATARRVAMAFAPALRPPRGPDASPPAAAPVPQRQTRR